MFQSSFSGFRRICRTLLEGFHGRCRSVLFRLALWELSKDFGSISRFKGSKTPSKGFNRHFKGFLGVQHVFSRIAAVSQGVSDVLGGSIEF